MRMLIFTYTCLYHFLLLKSLKYIFPYLFKILIEHSSMKDVVTFVVRKKLGTFQAINHARLSQSPRLSPSPPSSLLSSYTIPYHISFALRKLLRGIDTATRREVLSIHFDCALSRSDRLRVRSEIPGLIANGRTNEGTNELTVASPRGPILSGISISGARDTRQSRDPQPRGGPRYPRYVSTPARSWRESHVVPRDPFDKV